MLIRYGYSTEIGRKQTNQDSLLVQRAKTPKGDVALAVVCDGMGGLKKGELASAQVIRCFERWFRESFPLLLKRGLSSEKVFSGWNEIVQKENMVLDNYGRRNGISIGTTVTAVLVAENQYFIINVGDSRIYSVTDTRMRLLTKDQTLVMRLAERGEIKYSEIETDRRRSILLQCVGATDKVMPDCYSGQIDCPTVFLACSDGFRHLISTEEILSVLQPSQQNTEESLNINLARLSSSVLNRGEKDNITAVALHVRIEG